VDLEYDPYTAADHTNQCYGMSAPQLVDWIRAFSSAARRLTGRTPDLYTTAGWWSACTGDSTAFSSAPLWVAGFGGSQPARPEAWRSWAVWQYTSAGTVPGIAASGSTDVSYAAGYAAAAVNQAGEAAGQPGPFKPAATHRAAPAPSASAFPAGTSSAGNSAEPSAVGPDVLPAAASASAAVSAPASAG
jgi:hypothetical protein